MKLKIGTLDTCACVRVRVYQREKERQRETDRQTDRESERAEGGGGGEGERAKTQDLMGIQVADKRVLQRRRKVVNEGLLVPYLLLYVTVEPRPLNDVRPRMCN